MSTQSLSGSFFQNALFELFLTFDAVAGPRHGFQTFGVDLFAAGDAFAKVALADAIQCIFYHLEQLPLIIAL